MRLSPEQFDHISVVNWFHKEFPELADDFHHFANERKCTFATGKLLKSMGVKKGVADFFLAIPMNGKSGLWIELKVGKNKPTKEQSQFLARKLLRGYEALCVWGAGATKEIILYYLKEYKTHRDENDPKNLYYTKPIC